MRCNPRSKTTACNNALLCKVRRSIIEFIRDKIAYKVLNLTLKLICFIYKFKVLTKTKQILGFQLFKYRIHDLGHEFLYLYLKFMFLKNITSNTDIYIFLLPL